MVLCKHYLAQLIYVKNFDFKKLSTLLIGSFLIRVTILMEMSTLSRNLNHHWKCQEQKENLHTILVIMFWKFTIFQYRSDSPQVKGNLISSLGNLVYKLPHELPNDLRLRFLESQSILGKYQILMDTQARAQPQFKNLDFANSRFCFPVQFCWITLFCSK